MCGVVAREHVCRGLGRKEATWRVCGSGDGGGVVWRSTDEGEGATQGLLAGGSKRVWAPQAAETHLLHDDPRAARRGSAEEQTGGGPKARTEGERGRKRKADG